LETVTFASGSLLTTIGNGAFFSCSSLTSITIPASVESIGFGPFAACSSLASININQSNQNFSSFDGVLYDKPIHTLISYPGGKSGSTFTILSSVKTIGRSAFGSCAGLTSITIQASVESIGDAAFYGCTNLATVTFASNSKLQTFGFAAFYECYKLTSITMPGSVTSIFDNYQFGTFANSGLTIMYIPTINGLGLIPSTTPVTRYGRTFTVTRDVAADAAAAVAAAVPICFPAGTKVTTDQGDIAIENLQPKVYTIRGKKIVGITQTIPLQKHIISIEKDALAKNVPSVTTQISKEHKVFYKGKMVKARDLVEVCQGVTAIPYNGEILYNVLLKKHDKMMVNNLICETLDPENIVAKIYNGNFQPTEKSKICEKLNHIIRTNDIPEYKKLYASLK
jgi:hypothetical protein